MSFISGPEAIHVDTLEVTSTESKGDEFLKTLNQNLKTLDEKWNQVRFMMDEITSVIHRRP